MWEETYFIMKVWIIGMGCGGETITAEARKILSEADLMTGAPRLLQLASSMVSCEMIAEYRPLRIWEILTARKPSTAVCLVSGDPGFFSGAASLYNVLREHGINSQVIPGISSMQMLSARIQKPWQDWRICSAHGTECDPVFEVMQRKPVFFLTSGSEQALDICRCLDQAGLDFLEVTVGENLGERDERIRTASVRECLEMKLSSLQVLLVEPAPMPEMRLPGIPDEDFLRGKVPMTKQEIRCLVLSKLALRPADVCWDIGTGTGSVSVEMALQCRAVWSVEQSREALELAKCNRDRFHAWNLHLAEGTAPEALADFPKPDAVFVGGSGGRLIDILGEVHRRNPSARICVSAISLETLQTAVQTLEELGYQTGVVQVGISKSKEAGKLHLMLAQNPVFLITGEPGLW